MSGPADSARVSCRLHKYLCCLGDKPAGLQIVVLVTNISLCCPAILNYILIANLPLLYLVFGIITHTTCCLTEYLRFEYIPIGNP